MDRKSRINKVSRVNINQLFKNQYTYIKAQDFAGYDPFDGLNSPLIQNTFLNRSRWIKLAFLQFHKRFPFNLRPYFGIKMHRNPKGIALVVSSLIWAGKYEEEKETIHKLIEWLIENRTKGYEEFCWGYPFDWQALAFFQPKNTPTVVCSSFVGQAFLDVYKLTKEARFLEIACSIAEFMLNHLQRTKCKNGFNFSYSPEDASVIFNASALGARHLARCFYYTKNERYKTHAIQAIQPLVEYQNPDGSWAYGLQSHHGWIDNFHSGYNLECLHEVETFLSIRLGKTLSKGVGYYLEHLFKPEGFPKNLSTKDYPVDSHSPAQLFVTLYKLGIYKENQELAENVYRWWIEHLYDENISRFYFQLKTPYLKNKIDYMRWTQCWAFIGISALKVAQCDSAHR